VSVLWKKGEGARRNMEFTQPPRLYGCKESESKQPAILAHTDPPPHKTAHDFYRRHLKEGEEYGVPIDLFSSLRERQSLGKEKVRINKERGSTN